jgi:hypothetical protein
MLVDRRRKWIQIVLAGRCAGTLGLHEAKDIL